MKKADSGFEIYYPALATLRRDDERKQKILPCHLIKHGTIVVDYPISELLSWQHNVTRRQIGKAGVKHLALVTQDFRSGVRLVGIPIDAHDRPLSRNLQIDLRMSVNTHELDVTLPQRELDIVPDWLFYPKKQGIQFTLPKDLVERVSSSPPQPFLPYSGLADQLTA